MSDKSMMDIRTKWDQYYAAISRLQDVADDLSRLGKAFEQTGNSKMFNQLMNHVDNIDKSLEDIDRHVNSELNDKVRASEQATTNLIQCVLAGIDIGKGDYE